MARERARNCGATDRRRGRERGGLVRRGAIRAHPESAHPCGHVKSGSSRRCCARPSAGRLTHVAAPALDRTPGCLGVPELGSAASLCRDESLGLCSIAAAEPHELLDRRAPSSALVTATHPHADQRGDDDAEDDRTEHALALADPTRRRRRESEAAGGGQAQTAERVSRALPGSPRER